MGYHFEIWYAIEKDGDYLGFTRNLSEIVVEGYIAELAVSYSQEISQYRGVVGESADSDFPLPLVSVFHHKVAEALYDDDSRLAYLTVKPIIRCPKCSIMSIDGVFYYHYNQPKKGRQAATGEQVLARVCIPTDGKGDAPPAPCLAMHRHGVELQLKQKTEKELNEFVHTHNNSRIEFERESEEYYLKMAREIMSNTTFKYVTGQHVRFGSTPHHWKIVSRQLPEHAEEPQYYLESLTSPPYHQYVLESDLREVNASV